MSQLARFRLPTCKPSVCEGEGGVCVKRKGRGGGKCARGRREEN